MAWESPLPRQWPMHMPVSPRLYHAHVAGCYVLQTLKTVLWQPIERVRFMWGRGQVALAGVTAAVLAAAAGGTKTLVLSCKELE